MNILTNLYIIPNNIINNIINTEIQFSEINEIINNDDNISSDNDDEEYYLIKDTDIIAIDEGWVKMTKVIII